jgi:drug/metabolite transporter (DMT)-like permease
MITTRMVKETDDTVLMTTQFVGSFAFGAVMAPFGWKAPTAFDLIFMSGFGIVSIAALFCINRSLKLAPASVVVPYQYSLILWSVLLGWWMFGDVPDASMIIGGTIIVAAGLYIFWREQVVAREASFAPTPRPEAP